MLMLRRHVLLLPIVLYWMNQRNLLTEASNASSCAGSANLERCAEGKVFAEYFPLNSITRLLVSMRLADLGVRAEVNAHKEKTNEIRYSLHQIWYTSNN